MSVYDPSLYLFSDKQLYFIVDGTRYMVQARRDIEYFSAINTATGQQVENAATLASLYRLSVGIDSLARINQGNGIEADIETIAGLSDAIQKLYEIDAIGQVGAKFLGSLAFSKASGTSVGPAVQAFKDFGKLILDASATATTSTASISRIPQVTR